MILLMKPQPTQLSLQLESGEDDDADDDVWQRRKQ